MIRHIVDMHPYLWRTVVTVILLAVLAIGGDAVHAAKEAPPTVTACVVVATAGDISVFRCQDADRGTEFYLNSFGFMLATQ